MNYYDYFFYKYYSLFFKRTKVGFILTLIVITIVLVLNLATVILAFESARHIVLGNSKLFYITTAIVLFALNRYYFYKSKKYSSILKKYRQNDPFDFVGSVIVVGYTIVSVLLFMKISAISKHH